MCFLATVIYLYFETRHVALKKETENACGNVVRKVTCNVWILKNCDLRVGIGFSQLSIAIG